MNTLIANFLKKGYEPGPHYISIDENNYIRGISTDYTDGEKEFGEALSAYTHRTNYSAEQYKRFCDELVSLPDDYSLSDAALYVLRKCYEDRE